MKKGIISFGEVFIDYISEDLTNKKFRKFIGGTTINVAIGLSRLGTSSYYLCKLGENLNSQFVENELHRERVNLDYCIHSKEKKICGVYVHLNENGERYFHSYINETPDEMLLATELKEELFQKSRIFYFGSGTLFHPTAMQATSAAISLAQKNENLIAFDPNIRLKRWESEKLCRTTICSILSSVTILKLAEEELLFLMETECFNEAISRLHQYNIPYIWITKGEHGAYVICGEYDLHIPVTKSLVVDSTGAGDAFVSGILHQIHMNGLPTAKAELISYTEFANELGALAVTKIGALTAFPSKE